MNSWQLSHESSANQWSMVAMVILALDGSVFVAGLCIIMAALNVWATLR